MTTFHAIPRARFCADGAEQLHARCESSICPCDCHAIYAQMTVAQRLTNELEWRLEVFHDAFVESMVNLALEFEACQK